MFVEAVYQDLSRAAKPAASSAGAVKAATSAKQGTAAPAKR